jgi:hypothetical protein
MTYISPPYEISGTDQHAFAVTALVILRAGYAWVIEATECSPDSQGKRRCLLNWTLDFDRLVSKRRYQLKIKSVKVSS